MNLSILIKIIITHQSNLKGGIKDKSTAIWLSSISGFVNFVVTFSGLFFVDRIGRRKLLLFSIVGVCFSLLFISGAFFVHRKSTPIISRVMLSKETNYSCSSSSINDCNSCVNLPECGFCFSRNSRVDQFNLDYESLCLPIDETDSEYSKFGPCVKEEMNDNLMTSITTIKMIDNLNDSHFTDSTLINYDSTEINLTNDNSIEKPSFTSSYCPSNNKYVIVFIILGLNFYMITFACGLSSQVWVINR